MIVRTGWWIAVVWTLSHYGLACRYLVAAAMRWILHALQLLHLVDILGSSIGMGSPNLHSVDFRHHGPYADRDTHKSEIYAPPDECRALLTSTYGANDRIVLFM